MIEKPTVLVLGAGASAHLGYPTGAELVSRVISRLNKELVAKSPDFDTVYGNENRDKVRRFIEALAQSGHSSVDAFLEYRREFTEIGKLAISRILVPLEDRNKLFRDPSSWYFHLFSELRGEFDKIPDNNITFVTFNYDRSLEAFLYTALYNSYGASHGEIATVLNAIPMIHVHGQLGPLPWQGSDGRKYKQSSKADDISQAANSIKIIHEGTEDDPEFQRARTVLNTAELVHFIGFGYHRPNMQRLGFPWSDNAVVRGSCKDFTGHEVKRLLAKFPGIKFGDVGWDCTQYMRGFVSFE